MRSPVSPVLLLVVGFGLGCGPSRKELQADLDATRGELSRVTSARDTLSSDNQSLEERIAELDGELSDSGSRLNRLAADKQLTDEQLSQALEQQKRREKELETYKRLFSRLKKLVDTGKITVVFRKGKMMVQLQSAVLFDSGKTKLKEAGKDSLAEVVAALKGEGRDFLVAGHTDNVPIKTKRFRSNWELSAQRAVVVLNHMIEQGFPSKNLGAAGYGDVDPVSSNDTPEGRAENRRIEITLMPSPAQLKGIQKIFGTGKRKRKG